MMKIFYLVYGLTSGGIERISVDIYKYIDKNKFDLEIITKYNDREFFDDELESYGGKRKPILCESARNGSRKKIRYLINFIKMIRQGYDIAYFCLSKPRDVFKYPLLCKIFGVKTIVIHSHNSMEDNNFGIKRLMNNCGRKLIGGLAQIKIACSGEAAKWMFPSQTVINTEYILMKNGVDVNKYRFNEKIREKLKKQYHLGDEFIIGHIGRFTTQKNHKFLVDIFEQIHKKKSNSKLFLIGTGDLFEEVREYVIKKDLLEDVIFCGEKDNVCEYMQIFDAFVFPSLYEGLPVVGIEAQAAGLKCFFSDVITREVNITGNVKYLQLSQDAQTWADTIINDSIAYTRRDYTDVIRSKGFDIQSFVKKLEKALEENVLEKC